SFEFFIHVLQFGLSLGDRGPRLQSHIDRPSRIRCEWHPQRNDDVGEAGRVVTRDHTDDREQLTVKPERLSDSVWLTGEAALPELVRQHHNTLWLGSGRRVGFVKYPPEQRRNAKHQWRVTAERIGPY